MTDEEIYQQIEEYKDEANVFYKRVHEQVEASIVKHAKEKKRRKKFFTGIMSVVAVFIITLAIVLPIVLRPQEQGQEQEIRYSDTLELSHEDLNYNLKEYCAINNLPLLYLDWYEYAEELFTARYYEESKESETVYLYEDYTDGNTGYHIQISVMKHNIVIESLEERLEVIKTTTVNDTLITYTLNRNWCMAKFEYQGYKYYLRIYDEITLDFLVKTIESMFNN